MATNVYLIVEGEKSGEWKGSSRAAGHEDQIEVVSWNHSFNQPLTAASESAFGGSATARANHSHLQLTVFFDNASDEILKACWTGEYLKKVRLEMYRSAGTENVGESTPYLAIDLEQAIIADYSVSGGNEDLPVVNIALAYKKVTYTFTSTDDKGDAGEQVPISHNLGTNEIA
jgi:type VI secretion system secreted protein Hcp